jgi:hypothetical protein
MRYRALCLAGFALAVGPAAALGAGRPALSRLGDAYATNIGSQNAFRGDGSRFVTFTNANGQLVALDADAGTRSTVPLSLCGTSSERFAPSGLSQGQLITFCLDGTSSTAPDQYQLLDLVTHESRQISFDPPATLSPFPDLQGPGTDGTDWAFVLGGTAPSFNEGYLNLSSGAIVEPVPAITTTEYEDLDSPQLTHRLCAPVTTAVDGPGTGLASVIGFGRPWAVLEQDSNALDAPLYAWRCGAKRPVKLGSTDPQHAEYGAGIVTWIGQRGAVEATDLSTGRHYTWPAVRSAANGPKVGWAEVVHTANRIYAVPQRTAATSSGPQAIYTASLAGLLRPSRKP